MLSPDAVLRRFAHEHGPAPQCPARRLPLDPVLLVLAVALLLIGLIAISSASVGYAEARPRHMWHHSLRHGSTWCWPWSRLWSATSAYRVLVPQRLAVAVAQQPALILVLVPGVGRDVNGSQRWLAVGPLTLQPSELAKAAMILYLSGYLLRQGKALQEQLAGLFRPLMILGWCGAAARGAGFRGHGDHAGNGLWHAVPRRHASDCISRRCFSSPACSVPG
jgi:cell division protein FtsW (lipid II flippase)